MIVAFVRPQGGPGRTASASHVVEEWRRRDRDVLLVDQATGLAGGSTVALVARLRQLARHYDHTVVDASTGSAQFARASAMVADVGAVASDPSPDAPDSSGRHFEILRRADELRSELQVGLLFTSCATESAFRECAARAVRSTKLPAFDARIDTRAGRNRDAPSRSPSAGTDELRVLVDELENIGADRRTIEDRPTHRLTPRAAE